MYLTRSIRRAAMAVVLGVGLAANANAADVPSEPPEESETALTPDPDAPGLVALYAWLTFLNGSMTINGQRINVDTNIFDIIRESDDFFAVQGYSEYRIDPVTLFLDVTYVDLGAGRRDFLPVPVGTGLRLDYAWALIEAGANYEVAGWSSNGLDRHTVSVYGGARYTYNDVDMTIRVGPFRRRFNDTLNWVDPFVGVNYRGNFGNGWRANAKADVGGFGIGSDIAVHLFANVAKTIHKSDATEVSLALGYRYLYQDWSDGSGARRDAVDMTTHGPVLGLVVRF